MSSGEAPYRVAHAPGARAAERRCRPRGCWMRSSAIAAAANCCRRRPSMSTWARRRASSRHAGPGGSRRPRDAVCGAWPGARRLLCGAAVRLRRRPQSPARGLDRSGCTCPTGARRSDAPSRARRTRRRARTPVAAAGSPLRVRPRTAGRIGQAALCASTATTTRSPTTASASLSPSSRPRAGSASRMPPASCSPSTSTATTAARSSRIRPASRSSLPRAARARAGERARRGRRRVRWHRRRESLEHAAVRAPLALNLRRCTRVGVGAQPGIAVT